jgi:hypothetical protein
MLADTLTRAQLLHEVARNYVINGSAQKILMQFPMLKK